MGGAGILPTAIYNNKIYFLFGKENQYEKYAKGFSDFGGGQKKNESYIDTAVREGSEELMGFLGSSHELKKHLSKNPFYMDISNKPNSIYRTYIYPYPYCESLPFYYNQSQKFFQSFLSDSAYKNKCFEKSLIKWICIDDLVKEKPNMRFFYKDMIDQLLINKTEIKRIVSK
jgi:hypothetical protein